MNGYLHMFCIRLSGNTFKTAITKNTKRTKELQQYFGLVKVHCDSGTIQYIELGHQVQIYLVHLFKRNQAASEVQYNISKVKQNRIYMNA